MTRRIVHVVSNVDRYANSATPTGLWLSELTHAYDLFAAQGHAQSIVSPQGGASPLEPRSLRWPHADTSARRWLNDPAAMNLLAHTVSPGHLDPADFDAIYFTGGHAVMWDYPDDEQLQALTRGIYEVGGVVASVCHGYCGLLNTRLSDGTLLVQGKHITGFSWAEEVLAGVARQLPYNAEAEMKRRGAHYEKAWLPFIPKVVVDGRIVTGQNPQSAKATARKVAALLA
ncbi:MULTISPECIES: type 1 glutamine amidotransferase domain-containing protein [Comamonas]|jgi:putative intracellular protease/amidase|uniref:type 1 glutamine amidotransferase domain-containing protein n=1 Tax=Comamonas TaxID=283 RepID=UPI001C475150|nr:MULTISPECIES: type 1 glutamine amidotransferase domain-containing protein [Comamonas]MBV7420346.1 type 1 glutamine amidotransferase domain-containing protein [Comamonas sp. CMM03]MDI9854790.1 type 1 glutamine amidotransferase domain-containing protein [Comamonas sp. 17RB]